MDPGVWWNSNYYDANTLPLLKKIAVKVGTQNKSANKPALKE